MKSQLNMFYLTGKLQSLVCIPIQPSLIESLFLKSLQGIHETQREREKKNLSYWFNMRLKQDLNVSSCKPFSHMSENQQTSCFFIWAHGCSYIYQIRKEIWPSDRPCECFSCVYICLCIWPQQGNITHAWKRFTNTPRDPIRVGFFLSLSVAWALYDVHWSLFCLLITGRPSAPPWATVNTAEEHVFLGWCKHWGGPPGTSIKSSVYSNQCCYKHRSTVTSSSSWCGCLSYSEPTSSSVEVNENSNTSQKFGSKMICPFLQLCRPRRGYICNNIKVRPLNAVICGAPTSVQQ